MKLFLLMAVATGGVGASALAIRPLAVNDNAASVALAPKLLVEEATPNISFEKLDGPAASAVSPNQLGGAQGLSAPRQAEELPSSGSTSAQPSLIQSDDGGVQVAGAVQVTNSIPTTWIDNEPDVVYDITGGTLSGPYYLHFAAYTSGEITLVESSSQLDQPRVIQRQVSTLVVDTLMRDLQAAGAFSLTDSPVIVLDVPMTTVTMFTPSSSLGQSLAVTYSYFSTSGGGAYASVDQILQDFIDWQFPKVITN